MKSEHRHELKTNDLAKSLITFQDYVREYGGRVALGAAIVILAIVLIMQRMNKSQGQTAKFQDDLAYARAQIDRLHHVQVLDAEGHVTVRPAEVAQVPRLLQEVRDGTSDKKLQARALIYLGDYYWEIANYPELPATTEPALRPEERDRSEPLKKAKEAYQQALDQFGDQAMTVAQAHFGLAAVAEAQNNWDEAKRHYDAAKGLADVPESFKWLAEQKLQRLEQIRQPVMVGQVPDKFEPPAPPAPPPAPATTSSASQPAATKASTAPTTRPAK